MKNLIALIALLAIAGVASADVLLFEDFEDATVTYTPSTEFSDGDEDYFTRGSNDTTDRSYTNIPSGTSWFGGQDQDDTAAGGPGNDEEHILFSNIDIQGYTDLTFSAYFAEQRPEASGADDIDSTDYLHITYRIDGGAWNDLLWFENDGSTYNTPFSVDTDFDGVGDGGGQLETSFAEFTRSVAGTGSTLDIMIEAHVDSGDEDWAVDDVQITGVPEPATMSLLALGGLALLRRRRA
jgi:hypothetical protein